MILSNRIPKGKRESAAAQVIRLTTVMLPWFFWKISSMHESLAIVSSMKTDHIICSEA